MGGINLPRRRMAKSNTRNKRVRGARAEKRKKWVGHESQRAADMNEKLKQVAAGTYTVPPYERPQFLKDPRPPSERHPDDPSRLEECDADMQPTQEPAKLDELISAQD